MWRLGDAVEDLTNRFLDLIIFSDILWSFVLVYDVSTSHQVSSKKGLLHCTDSKNQQPYNKAPDYFQNVWDII